MSLRKKTIHGLGWSFGARIFRQISQFVVLAILARLLTPNDFGLIGMVGVFLGFASIFGELGITAAIIQNQNLEEKHYTSAFWINIVAGIGLMLIFIVCSQLIANFYNKPVLEDVIKLISFNFILSSFTVIQLAILKKEMNFKLIAIAESIAVVIAGVIGIYLAFHGYGVWSLVFQLMVFTFVNGCLLWIFSTWRPKFVFSGEAVKDIFNFSANVTGFNIVNYFARNIDYLLIGRFLGAGALGFYTLAYKIMLYPLYNISYVIGGVMFPAFSKIQNDLDKVRNSYLKMVKAISLITFLLMLGLFVVAPEFIRVLFGAQWEQVIPLFRILCFCGMFQSIGTTIGNIFMSQGRSDLQLKLQLIGTFIVVIMITVGLNWGIKGVALFYTLYSFGWVSVGITLSNKLIKLKSKRFFRSIFPAIIVAIIIAASIFFLRVFVASSDLNVLLLSLFLGISVYLAAMIVLKQILIKKHGVLLNI